MMRFRRVLMVGFWQPWSRSGRTLTLKTEVSGTTRAPSVIVYTPSGFVGVYFPPLSAKPFGGSDPTDPEAREAVRGERDMLTARRGPAAKPRGRLFTAIP